jgi:hypothetical protein
MSELTVVMLDTEGPALDNPNIIPNPQFSPLGGFLRVVNFEDSDERIYGVEEGGDPGTGNVIGPFSSLDNHIVTFNGTTGVLIKDSGVSFPIPVNQGGTGATEPEQARANLGILEMGDVNGPSSSVDAHLVSFDGTTGKLIADAGFSIPIPTSPDVGKVVQVDIAGTYILGTNGSGDVSGPNASLSGNIAVFDGITGKLIDNSEISFPIPTTAGGTGAITATEGLVNLGIPDPTSQAANQAIVTDGSGGYVLSSTAPGDITEIIAGIGLDGGGTSGSITLSIKDIAGVFGSYTYPQNVGVNGQGHITSIEEGTPPVTSVVGSDNILIEGDPTTPTISITGEIPLANGGTGTNLSSAPQGTLFYANGTGGLVQIAAGTANQVLTWDGDLGVPIWSSLS